MANRLQIRKPIKRHEDPGKYRILSLSGGGYRGLFTARVIDRLNAMDPASFLNSFDLFAGTSIGGLIAAGLAIGRTPTEMVDTIANHGPKIFDDRIMVLGRTVGRKLPGHWGGLWGAKFNADALEAAILDVLGAENRDLKIKDVEAPLLLVATCVTSRAPFLMTNILRQPNAGSEMKVSTALRATSAAPGYFPAVDLNTRSLVDGGLLANAPDMMAITTVLKEKRAGLDRIAMISVGTAGPDNTGVPSIVGTRGLIGWLRRDLVPILLETQEKVATSQAKEILGDRHWRVNASPSADQAAALGLDRAPDEATRVLVALADEAMDRIDRTTVVQWAKD